jgi:hypothetical protein
MIIYVTNIRRYLLNETYPHGSRASGGVLNVEMAGCL